MIWSKSAGTLSIAAQVLCFISISSISARMTSSFTSPIGILDNSSNFLSLFLNDFFWDSSWKHSCERCIHVQIFNMHVEALRIVEFLVLEFNVVFVRSRNLRFP